MPLLLLGGCDINPPMGPGLVSIRADGEAIEFGLCQARMITKIVGEYRSDDVDWTVFLEAHGATLVRAGETFGMEFVESNFTVTENRPVPLEDVQITVVFHTRNGAAFGLYSLDGRLSDELWRHNDQSETAEVCAKLLSMEELEAGESS